MLCAICAISSNFSSFFFFSLQMFFFTLALLLGRWFRKTVFLCYSAHTQAQWRYISDERNTISRFHIAKHTMFPNMDCYIETIIHRSMVHIHTSKLPFYFIRGHPIGIDVQSQNGPPLFLLLNHTYKLSTTKNRFAKWIFCNKNHYQTET